jgi:hypothetical protein
MRSSASRFGSTLVSLFAGAVGLAGLAVFAPKSAAVPVEVDMPTLRAIQPLEADKEKGEDPAYLLVNGVANGKEFNGKLPKDGTWTVGPKKPVGDPKNPVALWKGDLGDGEFALVTVTLMQGKGADAAKIKEYADKKAEAEKTAADRSKPKLTKAEFDKLHVETLKAQHKLIEDVKKIFSRELKTDHFGGLFNVLVWNNGGKVVKRLDPIGLTFGADFGTDLKIYSKIKNTRPNVLIKDDKGEWGTQQLMALADDQTAVRVKMLENEKVMPPGGKEEEMNTCDYVAEIQVKAGGAAQKWELGGEQTGVDYDNYHIFWDFAQ